VHCRASIFGALRLPSSTDWIFFGENRRRIDRDFKTFSVDIQCRVLGLLFVHGTRDPPLLHLCGPVHVQSQERERERERERVRARSSL